MAERQPTGAEQEATEALSVLPPARLGSLLRDRRKERRIGARRAAQTVGIGVSVLEGIESGRALPDVNVLAALLTCYGVQWGEFFPRRERLPATQRSGSSEEVLRGFIDEVRRWRGAGARQKLRFRQEDIASLAQLLGSDPGEIERRLIALTGCSPAEARRLRKWLLAALVTIPVTSPLVGGVAASASATSPPSARAATAASQRVAPREAHKLIWHDDFNGPAGAVPDPTRWHPVTGGDGWGNHELEYYTARPTNVSLDGHGHLAITARQEPYGGSTGVRRDYTSARIQTKGLFASRYGQIQARIKLPAGQGLWPAFWALGTDGSWPEAGEIDLMENIGSDPYTIFGSIHGPEAGSGGAYAVHAQVRSRVSLAANFHIYGVDWSPGRIVFTLDGVPYATRTRADLSHGEKWVFDKPFYLLLNLAVGGTWPGRPDHSTKFPATMLVDWVRVYE